MALGVHSKASNHAVKGELGRFPLHLIIYIRIFKYFLRLLTLQNNQILNSALEIRIHLNNVGKHSWFTNVRHLLHFTKLNDYTPNLPHLDYRTFPHLVRMFKRNLFECTEAKRRRVRAVDSFQFSALYKLTAILRRNTHLRSYYLIKWMFISRALLKIWLFCKVSNLKRYLKNSCVNNKVKRKTSESLRASALRKLKNSYRLVAMK